MLDKIIFSIIVIIGASVTLGYGNALETSTILGSFGAESDIPVTKADAFVTKVTWNETNNKITSVTVEIKNTDNKHHKFQICVISTAGQNISDRIGSKADCDRTGRLPSKAIGIATIEFSNPLKTKHLENTDISIEQIS